MKINFRWRHEKVLISALLFIFTQGSGMAQTTSPWKQDELNETFMRSLSKDQCMDKTIASLKNGCQSNECLKTLAGITGDCQTWGKGDPKEFCADYDRKYLARYCFENELDAKKCYLLHVAKPRPSCEFK